MPAISTSRDIATSVRCNKKKRKLQPGKDGRPENNCRPSSKLRLAKQSPESIVFSSLTVFFQPRDKIKVQPPSSTVHPLRSALRRFCAVRRYVRIVPVVISPRHLLKLEYVLPHIRRDFSVASDFVHGRPFRPWETPDIANPFL